MQHFRSTHNDFAPVMLACITQVWCLSETLVKDSIITQLNELQTVNKVHTAEILFMVNNFK
jgi:hypothetical protein